MADPLVSNPGPAHGGETEPRRLGKNINGYFGETIDIASVLDDCAAAARTYGWDIEKIPAAANLDLLAFTRPSPREQNRDSPGGAAGLRIYVSTGIHGDEPAGPLAARQLLRENNWPAN